MGVAARHRLQPEEVEDQATHNVLITDSTFNEVSGNSYVTYHNCTVYAAYGGDPLRTRALERFGGRDHDVTRCGSKDKVLPAPAVQTDATLRETFQQARQSLDFINKLIEPHSHPRGMCFQIPNHLRELAELLDFSSKAYYACDSHTVLGKLMKTAIDHRIRRCQALLRRVHGDIAELPHFSLPVFPLICRVLYEWWTGTEPEEIAAVRLDLRKEARAVGEWLCSIKL